VGVDMIETDILSSKDEKVVIMHDDDFNRTCALDKKPIDLDFADFPKFQDKIPLDFTPGKDYIRKKSDAETFSLLEEAFT
jgi:glycerophosphoryl diester phosphodiesterase